MNVMRIAIAIGGLALAGAIVWAMMTGSFGEAGAWLTSDPWGIVTLGDLYLGFVIAAVLIAQLETGWRRLFWIAPIFVLGNVWTALWIVLRLPALWHRFRPGVKA
ncbi:MAG TPA: hypothetical protein PKE65_00555 [Rhizobiaceae bacterium]|nr:hypothetical protein [Rhizobiaceae bacterium]